MTGTGQDTTTKVMLKVPIKCECSKVSGNEPVNSPFITPPIMMLPQRVNGCLAAYAWRASISPEMQIHPTPQQLTPIHPPTAPDTPRSYPNEGRIRFSDFQISDLQLPIFIFFGHLFRKYVGEMRYRRIIK